MIKKVFLICVGLLFFLSGMASAEDMSIKDFKFGLIKEGADGEYYVYQETTKLPFQEGAIYGFTYNYIKNTEKDVEEKCVYTFSSPAENLQASTEDTIIVPHPGNMGLTVINYIKDKEGPWIFAGMMDKGDSLGPQKLEVYHNEQLFKVIEFEVTKEQKNEN